MAKQGVGCVVSLDKLVDTSEGSLLCFQPLSRQRILQNL